MRLFRHLIVLGIAVLLPVSAFAQDEDPPALGTDEAKPPPPPDAAEPPPPVADETPAEPVPANPMPALPSQDDKPAAKVYYDKGFTFLTPDERFKLHMKSQFQARLEVNRLTGDGQEWRSRFQISRARLIFDGHVFGKELGYKAEFAIGDKGQSFLKDLYFDRKFGAVTLRGGQFKRPFNRQEISSDFGTELVEKSITQTFSLAGRDLGIGLHNGYEKSPEGIEWFAGVFNGGSDRPTTAATTVCTVDPLMPAAAPRCTTTIAAPTNVPGDFGPMFVGRVGYNHGKIKGYSEADLEGGPLRFAVGLSYRANFNNLPKDAVVESIQHGVEADFMVKVNGLSATGGVFVNKEPGDGVDPQLAFFVQGGYFLTPKKLQAVARFALVPHPNGVDGNTLEIRGGFNDYFQGHDWKWVTDVGVIKNTETGASTEIQLRTGVQLAF